MSRILIIDDEQAVREELRDRIEVMGFGVDQAACVDEALKHLEEIAYKCVLLDLGIPRSFEGPISIHHGRTLLQRIVALRDAPPVLVITANGLDNYQLATAVFENGAKGFIAKPFDTQAVEEKIRKQFEMYRRDDSLNRGSEQHPFGGGDLVMHEDRIELCGVYVGGRKGNALIRQVLYQLSRKNSAGRYTKASGKELADKIGAGATGPKIVSAIQDFRQKCKMNLGCGSHDVIATCRGGGYQLGDKINFLTGSEERVPTQAEGDQRAILKEIRGLNGATSRDLADRTQIPLPRVKAALSRLDDEQKVVLKGSGTNAVYFIREIIP